MRVLFIARRFPPSVGGMEKFAYDLNKALSKQIHLRNIKWGGSNKWLPFVLPWFFIKAFYILLTHKEIRVIHIQDAVQAPIGWGLNRIFKRPYIVVAHGLDITYDRFSYQKIVLPFVRRASAVISISTATEKEVLARGIKKKRSFVITPGSSDDYSMPIVDKTKLGKELDLDIKGRLLLLTTGRLVKRKGVAWFINNVMPDLVSNHPSVLYLVAGEGEDRLEVEDAIRMNKLEDYVVMLGRVSDSTRALLYQSSDVFVMPNIFVVGDMEGFGIVAHEAALAELPVVASGIEGIVDAVKDGENGKLVASGDRTTFKNEISKMLKDKDERRRFGKKSREYTLSNYSWDTIAGRYLEVYESVAKHGTKAQ